MELCTSSHTVSNVVNHKRLFTPNPNPLPSILLKTTKISYRNPGALHFATPLRRATTSEENPTFTDGPGGVVTMEKSPSDEYDAKEKSPSDEYEAKEKSPSDEYEAKEKSPSHEYEAKAAGIAEEASLSEQVMAFEFLEGFNLKKLESERLSQMIIYGSGAVVAVWLSSVVVGAIDSIPLVPKVLELVGLGFTIWFSSRYLVLKKNREELFGKIEEVKQQIIGSDD